MPITAACATAGWPIAAFSTAALEIHSPPDLITSLERSTISTVPSGKSLATSPVCSQPSGDRRLLLEVSADDQRTARLQMTEGHTVMRQRLARIVDDAELRRERDPALPQLLLDPLLVGRVGETGGRAHLVTPSASVMPQACATSMPWRCSSPSISERGGLVPATRAARSDGSSRPLRSRWSISIIHTVGTQAAMVTFSAAMIS